MSVNKRFQAAAAFLLVSCLFPHEAHATWYVCVPSEVLEWGVDKAELKRVKIRDINSWVTRFEDEKGFLGGATPTPGVKVLQKLHDDYDLVGVSEVTLGFQTEIAEIRIRKQKDGTLGYRCVNSSYVSIGTCKTATFLDYYKPVKQGAGK